MNLIMSDELNKVWIRKNERLSKYDHLKKSTIIEMQILTTKDLNNSEYDCRIIAPKVLLMA